MAQTLVSRPVVRQAQRQRLSPRMLLSASLLAKPLGELREEVKKEIESNPAIDDASYAPFFRRGIAGSADVSALLENVAAGGESLAEHLEAELRMSDANEQLKTLARLVIGDIDENGRFVGSLPDLVMASGAREDEIEKARLFVMTLDPVGCAAKNTAECLMAQLVKVPPADRAGCANVIARWDDLVAQKLSFSSLKADDLATFRKYRGKLKINPGEGFAPRRVETVTPDIIVDKDGNYFVDMADIPEIKISIRYLSMAKDRTLDPEARQYAQERIRHAEELQKAIVERHDTLDRLVGTILSEQSEFVKRGPSALKTLTMTEIAKKAGCKVWTVSRAASGKYVKTPRGTIPLRLFFTQLDQGKLNKLREILSEAKQSGVRLSDKKIAEMMKKDGFEMARRTVAKYRLKLN